MKQKIIRIVYYTPPISVNHMYGSKKSLRFLKKEGREYKRKLTQVAIKKAGKKFKPSTGNIKMQIKYYFPDKRRRDVSNYEKPILDSLTGIIYKDDCLITKLILEKSIDRENPRTEIIIKL